jgi:hypothetical protein
MWRLIFVIALVFVAFILPSNNTVKVASSSLSDFTFLKSIPQDETSETQIIQPEGVDVDSEGNVYVNDIEPNSIIKFSKNGSYLLSWDSTGLG